MFRGFSSHEIRMISKSRSEHAPSLIKGHQASGQIFVSIMTVTLE